MQNPNRIYLSMWDRMMVEKAESIIMGENQEEFSYKSEEANIIHGNLVDESGQIVGEVSVEASDDTPEGFLLHKWVIFGESLGGGGGTGMKDLDERIVERVMEKRELVAKQEVIGEWINSEERL